MTKEITDIYNTKDVEKITINDGQAQNQSLLGSGYPVSVQIYAKDDTAYFAMERTFKSAMRWAAWKQPLSYEVEFNKEQRLINIKPKEEETSFEKESVLKIVELLKENSHITTKMFKAIQEYICPIGVFNTQCNIL